MIEHEFMLGVRNILLVNLLAVAMAPDAILRLHRRLIRKWKALRARISITLSSPGRSKFWEIDMTKFEP